MKAAPSESLPVTFTFLAVAHARAGVATMLCAVPFSGTSGGALSGRTNAKAGRPSATSLRYHIGRTPPPWLPRGVTTWSGESCMREKTPPSVDDDAGLTALVSQDANHELR
jgi:hypothetical protein